MIPIVVVLSGNGSNLQAIIDQIHGRSVDIKAVVSDQENAYGLVRAKVANIPTRCVPHIDGEPREEYCSRLAASIETIDPALIILAGFMYILSSEFVAQFENRILNIHPSLLPRFRGLNTHKRVLEAGDTLHGITIHVVTENLDDGPILIQQSYHVMQTDTEYDLVQRGHDLEHLWYPWTIDRLAKKETLFTKQPIHEHGAFESQPVFVDPKYFLL